MDTIQLKIDLYNAIFDKRSELISKYRDDYPRVISQYVAFLRDYCKNSNLDFFSGLISLKSYDMSIGNATNTEEWDYFAVAFLELDLADKIDKLSG